ncbi:hypothetical protein G6N82_07090 [Altererythrobacter sp. BO-6]|uniref:energy transducer TonB n=1 Tax=Altererythrobacter sp. BO-6 TaxID=2604537 RepID=UPI0013E1CD29|nr:energy transducer TonB [Altererythrobacter sp. BO-6]QIG53950.1 hypothetical protein G6N82_07090 [Altererythrobacter sp. BO-6]
MDDSGYLHKERKLRPGVLALIVVLHVLALYGLTRAFAPQVTATIERSVVEAFTVTITAPPDDPPEVPDEGMAGDAGKEAVPQPVTAPTPKVTPRPDRQLPRASSTGDAATSGARDSGDGTGASGSGEGTGSGDEGSGQGSSMATGPVKIAGTINSARDYPVPEGGREIRFGRAVRIAILVATDGRPKRCRVFRSSGLPDTDARTCELAMDRFRFEPARNARGQPVEAEFGWEQRFRRAD